MYNKYTEYKYLSSYLEHILQIKLYALKELVRIKI